MPTRNVVLSDHQHDLVETLVQPGRHQSASEVLREAADKGWCDITAGRYTDVADDQLDDIIGQLGQTAATRVQSPV